jgi:hypothetical protein
MILLLTFWFGISLIHQKMRENIRKSTSQVPVEACYGNVIVWLKKWKLWRKKTIYFYDPNNVCFEIFKSDKTKRSNIGETKLHSNPVLAMIQLSEGHLFFSSI